MLLAIASCSGPPRTPPPPTTPTTPTTTTPLPATEVVLRTRERLVCEPADGPVQTAPSPVTRAPAAGAALWARSFGGAGWDEGAAIAVAPDGGIYVAGQFEGAARFGDHELDSAGGSDVYLARLTPAGDVTWVQPLAGAGTEFASGLAIDREGNVAVVGSYRGELDLDGHVLQSVGQFDLFVASFDPRGDLRWARTIGAAHWGLASDVAVDTDGDVVVVGMFDGILFVDDRELYTAGEADAFVVRYAGDGALAWAMRAGGRGWDEAHAVAVSASGDAVVVGAFEGTADVGGAQLTSAGRGDAWVARIARDGEVVRARAFGGEGDDTATTVAIGADEHVLIAGRFTGEARFGGEPVRSAGARDLFLARLSPDDEPVWSRRFGGSHSDCARAVAVAPDGEIVVMGTADGATDLFVAGYAPDAPAGAARWHVRYLGTGIGAAGIAVGAGGELLIAGSYLGGARFGAAELDAAGGFDAFVVALARGAGR